MNQQEYLDKLLQWASEGKPIAGHITKYQSIVESEKQEYAERYDSSNVIRERFIKEFKEFLERNNATFSIEYDDDNNLYDVMFWVKGCSVISINDLQDESRYEI